MKKAKQLKKNKHPLTLIEMLVALFILSILLTLILGFFRELSTIDQWTKEQQTKSFQKRYVESRLFYVFSQIVNDSDTSRTSFFFSDPPLEEVSLFPSLVFTYSNGVRFNPSFSGDVLGRLYVNKECQLCLATWPLPSKQGNPIKYEPNYEMQKEVLIEDVKAIKFEFFLPPNRPPNLQSETEMVKGWQENWLISYKQTPALMKMTLTLKEDSSTLKKHTEETVEELSFMFYLPVSKGTSNYIYYKNSL